MRMMGVKMMNDILQTIWGDFVFSGISIPIICFAFSMCLKYILTAKIARNKFTNLIPLFSMILGAIIMVLVHDFLPVLHFTKTRIYMGMVLGLSATGIHQVGKRLKRFFAVKKIEKNYKEISIEKQKRD